MSTKIIISLRHDTPVSVVYPKNSSDIWSVIRRRLSGVTYCESVFRKSFVENVEVFLLEGWHGTTLTSYRYLWRVAFCVPYAPYLSECGVLCRLFPVRSFHNLQQDKRNQLHTFLYKYTTIILESGCGLTNGNETS